MTKGLEGIVVHPRRTNVHGRTGLTDSETGVQGGIHHLSGNFGICCVMEVPGEERRSHQEVQVSKSLLELHHASCKFGTGTDRWTAHKFTLLCQTESPQLEMLRACQAEDADGNHNGGRRGPAQLVKARR